MTDKRRTKRTSQEMDNMSYDELYDENTILPVVEEDGVLVRQPKIATEETLQAVLAAQGGSVYNYIQSATDATYKYYGYASSTGWKFKRKTLATGIWMVAEGTGDYDTAWAARSSKTYNYTS